MAASAERDRIRISTERFTIEGRSRAGNETWFRIRELGIALDIGRCPDLLVSVPNIFVTHAHLDHALGIPFYFSQRNLQRLSVGTVFVPASNEKDFEALMRLHERLEGVSYEFQFAGMQKGDERTLRKDLNVRAHASSHRVPTNSYEFIEVRHKLQTQYVGLSGEELGALRSKGAHLEDRLEHSLLFYTGDTDRMILEQNDALFQSSVLMIECSFTSEGDRERGLRYRHMHVDDLYEFSDRFENDVIVLTHFSMRDSEEDIRSNVARRCPARLRSRIRLALPEPFTTLN